MPTVACKFFVSMNQVVVCNASLGDPVTRTINNPILISL